MAKTLMETLQSSLSGQPQPQPGMQDQSAQVQNVLRAKLGKAGGPPGEQPRASNIQEQQAVQQGRLGALQQQAQGQLQSQAIQQEQLGQQVKEQEQQLNLDEQREGMRSKFELQSEDVAQELSRGLRDLDSKQQQQKMEQAGFLVRMQNDQYVTNLKNAAAKARIQSDRDFKIQSARAAFADEEEILKDRIFMQEFIDASRRDYEVFLNGIDVHEEIKKAKREQSNKEKRQRVKAATDIVSVIARTGAQSGGGESGGSADMMYQEGDF